MIQKIFMLEAISLPINTAYKQFIITDIKEGRDVQNEINLQCN